jgi:hypothetical protein
VKAARPLGAGGPFSSLPSLVGVHPATRVAVISALVLLCMGCGSGKDADPEATPPPDRRASPPLRKATCPDGLARCRAASGRILFVERVDPDGDGDAHFVLASRDSVTAPGVTVVDVRRGLRPRPLPGPGDRLSAAGPVFTGSYGQRQVEAVEVFVQRR